MSQNVIGLRLEDLEIKPHLITKLKGGGFLKVTDQLTNQNDRNV